MANKRIVGLDIMRVFCVMVVCAFHTSIHLGCNYGILQRFVSNGNVIMSVFFMMSGFCLTITNTTDTHEQLLMYLKKRIISIYPLYIICAIGSDAMIFIYALTKGEELESLKNILLLAPIEALGLQSIFTTLFPYNHNSGTWFVSCLMVCYVLFPAIKKVVDKLGKKQKIFVLVTLYFVVIYSSVIVALYKLASLYTNPFIRLFEFMIGLILCSLWKEAEKNKEFSYTYIVFLVSTASLIICVSIFSMLIDYKDCMIYGFIVIPLSMIMMLSAVQLESNIPFVEFMSRFSYSFFLAQLFSNNILKFVFSLIGPFSNIITIILGWSSCLLISLVLHYGFEVPITAKLKQKYLCSVMRTE